MLSVAEFFAPSHWGNLFGAKGPLYGLSGHRGHDVNGWRAGTAIPWIGTGPVVRSERQTGLGWVVTIRDPRGVYISNCHMQSAGVPVGKTIQYIGEYAGPIGNTGTLSLGVHDHVVVSLGSNPATSTVINPLPFINAARLATAGSTGVPLVDPIPPAPIAKDTPMTQFVYTNLIEPLTPQQETLIRSCVGGSGLDLTVGKKLRVSALLGDSPGTPANVQLTQRTDRERHWAADHTGAMTAAVDGDTLGKGGRPVEYPEFFALLAAYSTHSGGGSPVQGDVSGVETLLREIRDTLAATPAEIDRYSDGKKQSA